MSRNEYNREWARAHPEARRAHNRRAQLKYYYGITPERYDELLAEQGGACAICGADSPGRRYKHFSVDHDHACCPSHRSCGACVRGLLCAFCNSVVVRVLEGPHRAAADAYLLLHREKLEVNPRIIEYLGTGET